MFDLERAAMICALQSKIKKAGLPLTPHCIIDGDSVRAELTTPKGHVMMMIRAYDYEDDAAERIEAYLQKLSLYLMQEEAA